ncbi:PTS galactosamine/N-acetylgalactosamine transporter subunit IIA [Vibrio scophthalmi]|uniref:Protein-N(Pi)-phosphohistidine--sugar phosphotransferase n=1 Tax=Vibrio scophthalmi TaxID=45658 RepID=A0A1C7FAW1_9VIBR|nr:MULTISPECIES: PTS galactosamine/N-acetylgalactosamine transporter subunit IIA [Vibrio]ANU36857.1 Protein-N(pi)-phosphohistidine--sugar phosphotransferase [Vibrio scophthalmi]EGU31910.1 phosphotransferase system, mannose/fructose-specific component IIA [Vibrio sp. N418]MCY9802016.1 PTS galactosamine/N-acetylgalactosamine transporter subunit IIA [Vibrio scophthalmi]ODS11803.1 Protein-N(pi)-phosphohistidine--sugar phosphotransferase [Vibrio scophthalmi]
MIAVILSGHGGFASGIAQAIHQVIGEQAQFKFIDFPEESTTPQLEAQMRQAITDIDSGEGIVFLTDLLGGTPFRTASLLSQERNDIQVVTGTNLQMAAEMLLERDELNLLEFRDQALECGHRGITSLAAEMALRNEKEAVVEDDGI